MRCNYRVCFRPSVPESGLQIHEVYYNEDGKVVLYVEKPVDIFGDNLEELYENLKMLMDSLDRSTLDLDMIDMRIKNESKTD